MDKQLAHMKRDLAMRELGLIKPINIDVALDCACVCETHMKVAIAIGDTANVERLAQTMRHYLTLAEATQYL